MKKLLVILGLMAFAIQAKAAVPGFNSDTFGNIGVVPPATVMVSSAGLGPVSSSATAVTAGGVQLYNYITNIHIEEYSTGTVVGNTVPVVCTSSNIPGTPTFTLPTAQNVGAETFLDMTFTNPIKSVTPNNVTAVTCPPQAGMKYNVILGYFQDN